MPTRKKTVVADAAPATAPTPPLARTPKSRRRTPVVAAAATAEVVPPGPVEVAAPLDPITTEVPWADEEGAIPPFLRDRTPRPALPVVHIIGEAPAARPTPPPAPSRSPDPGEAPAAAEGSADRYEVYLMGDTDKQIYYIGLTDNHDRRLRQHISAATHPRSLWLQQLIIGEGRRPLVQVAGTYPTYDAAKVAEDEWIEHYRMLGHPLTNDLTPRERRAGRAAEMAPAPAVVAAPPPAPAATPPTPANSPPLPARAPVVQHWVMGIAAALAALVIVAGVAWLNTSPSVASNARPGAGLGALRVDTSAPQAAPTELGTAPGALENPPTAAPARVGSHSVAVQPGQTLADVAGLLNTTPEALAAQLGRSAVYAGETVVRDLYAGDVDTAALSQGGGATPTVDIHNGKGVDAPIAPVVETTVLASTGLCPPGTARAGQPRDGRVVVPFEPGCAPEDAGQIGPQSQPWVPGPPTKSLAQGGGPPSSLPATGGGNGLLPAPADLVGAVADTAAAALEQTAPPPPVAYCADGTVRDLAHRTRAPFVPGCAPLAIGPERPSESGEGPGGSP